MGQYIVTGAAGFIGYHLCNLLLRQGDHVFGIDNLNDYYGVQLKKQPSQYYRDHLKFSFVCDRMAMRLREYIGVDMLMWGSDFPHIRSIGLDAHETLERILEGLTEEEQEKLVGGNVARVYGL